MQKLLRSAQQYRRRIATVLAGAALVCVTIVSTMAAPSSAAPQNVAARAAAPQSAPALANLPVVRPATSCDTLTGQDLARIPDFPTAITSATMATAAQGWQYCDVKGLIAPQIQFEMQLPTDSWRQRYVQTGCGGTCGTLSINAPQSAGCAPLNDGALVLASNNMGHVGSNGFFGTDPQLRIDLAYRADHALAVVAKKIIRLFYGQGPRFSYFSGCSLGGHEAFTEAQRYPKDFDGIVAGSPASIVNELGGLMETWLYQANIDASGNAILTADKLPALHEAVLAACDAKDGLVDQQIDDPRLCTFDPRTVQCAAGVDNVNCLTPAQVAVVRKAYSGPVDRHGRHLYPGAEPRGSELAWVGEFVPARPGASTFAAAIAYSRLRFLAFKRPLPASFELTDVRFTDKFLQELQKLDWLNDAIDTDLSAFRNHGGKLFIYQGWADSVVPPTGTIAYYRAVTKQMGGLARTEQFARLFMIPGMYHCSGGLAPNTFDSLTPVMEWVERGAAPQRLVATAVNAGELNGRTRPVYPYPNVARYNGNGSIDDAANFHPVRGYDAPVPWLGTFPAHSRR
jgi:feruloyl esterase